MHSLKSGAIQHEWRGAGAGAGGRRNKSYVFVWALRAESIILDPEILTSTSLGNISAQFNSSGLAVICDNYFEPALQVCVSCKM